MNIDFNINLLIWAIIGALFSILFSNIIPFYLSRRRYKKRTDILGVWKSSYQGIDEKPGTWVTEDLEIDTFAGKLSFKNTLSSKNYNYNGSGNLLHDVNIIGEWNSVRPGATAKGTFMLTLCAQGDCMYGYWTGTDSFGARRYARWVLARNKKDLNKVKKYLDEMRKSKLS